MLQYKKKNKKKSETCLKIARKDINAHTEGVLKKKTKQSWLADDTQSSSICISQQSLSSCLTKYDP